MLKNITVWKYDKNFDILENSTFFSINNPLDLKKDNIKIDKFHLIN